MKIIENILTDSECYQKNAHIDVKGIVLHSVGCNQPKASVFLKKGNKPGVYVCPHAYIDGLDGDVYQALPWNHRGWHGGCKTLTRTVNDTHIGIEVCEPDCLKYVGTSDRFSCTDPARAKEICDRTYKSAVKLFAYLCKLYSLNPLADGVILSHKEAGQRQLSAKHTDINHLWEQLKLPYTMDGFRNDVAKEMGILQDSQKTESKKIVYRVQVGSFSMRKNADSMAKALEDLGYNPIVLKAEV